MNTLLLEKDNVIIPFLTPCAISSINTFLHNFNLENIFYLLKGIIFDGICEGRPGCVVLVLCSATIEKGIKKNNFSSYRFNTLGDISL